MRWVCSWRGFLLFFLGTPRTLYQRGAFPNFIFSIAVVSSAMEGEIFETCSRRSAILLGSIWSVLSGGGMAKFYSICTLPLMNLWFWTFTNSTQCLMLVLFLELSIRKAFRKNLKRSVMGATVTPPKLY